MRVSAEEFNPLDLVRGQVSAALQGALTGPLVGLGAEGGGVCLWWLAQADAVVQPLSDRVELAVYDLLERGGAIPAAVYPLFPGLLTPEADLVTACFAAYGQPEGANAWRLRPEERREVREAERSQLVGHLLRLGQRLGYQTWLAEQWRGRAAADGETLLPAEDEGQDFDPGPLRAVDVLWHEDRKVAHVFAVQWMGLLGPFPRLELAGAHGYVVLPDERVELVRLKLRRSSPLRQTLAAGPWHLVKYSALRRLVTVGELARHDLKKIIGLEPIIEKPEAQMPLF
jgi:hypothetical protein